MFLFLAAAFVPAALLRPIDGDEGFYLMASRLVRQGKLPYADFFFLQMPFLPYVHAALSRIFGESWISARVLSALVAAGIGPMLHAQLRRTSGSAALAWTGVILYGASSFVVGWFPIVKAYGLATLLLFGAQVALRAAPPRVWTDLLAGALLSLSVQTRLYFAAAAPVFLAFLVREVRWQRRVALCVMGGVIAALPLAVIVSRDPGAFAFGNFYYHAVRTDRGLIGDPARRSERSGSSFPEEWNCLRHRGALYGARLASAISSSEAHRASAASGPYLEGSLRGGRAST